MADEILTDFSDIFLFRIKTWKLLRLRRLRVYTQDEGEQDLIILREVVPKAREAKDLLSHFRLRTV